MVLSRSKVVRSSPRGCQGGCRALWSGYLLADDDRRDRAGEVVVGKHRCPAAVVGEVLARIPAFQPGCPEPVAAVGSGGPTDAWRSWPWAKPRSAPEQSAQHALRSVL